MPEPLTQFPHDLLRYEPETGKMYWRKNRYRDLVGKEAGSLKPSGRWDITITFAPYCTKVYLRSRLAFLWAHGRWPTPTVDHINRDKSDDRLANLREATRSEQQINRDLPKNNTSGARNVSWVKSLKRWRAQITIPAHSPQRLLYVGVFKSKADAINARIAAEKRYNINAPPDLSGNSTAA